eukprot:jgi/Psemu1/36367/gm1.36367_g
MVDPSATDHRLRHSIDIQEFNPSISITSQSTYKLHEDYQRKNTPEFKYFFKRILGAVSSKQTDFKRKSLQTTISNIFTSSYEAFALLFLYNDYKSWLNTIKGTRKRKKLTDSKSRIKEGWSEEGQELHAYVKSEREKQRKEQQTKDLEIELLLKIYEQQNGYQTQQHKEDKDNRKKKRHKQKYDMMETLDKDD